MNRHPRVNRHPRESFPDLERKAPGLTAKDVKSFLGSLVTNHASLPRVVRNEVYRYIDQLTDQSPKE